MEIIDPEYIQTSFTTKYDFEVDSNFLWQPEQEWHITGAYQSQVSYQDKVLIGYPSIENNLFWYFVGIYKIPQRAIGLVLRYYSVMEKLLFVWKNRRLLFRYYYSDVSPEHTPVIILGILPLMQGFLIPHSDYWYSVFHTWIRYSSVIFSCSEMQNINTHQNFSLRFGTDHID